MPIKYIGKSIAEQLNEFRLLKQRLPAIIGNEIVNFAKENIRKGGFQGDSGFAPWAPRKPALISRFRDSHGGSRGLMVDTGRLQKSIRVVAKSPTQVTVGVLDVPYAAIHNEGGTITQRPTFKQRMFFSHLSNEALKGGDKQSANIFAAISTASVLTIEIPKRTFLAPSKTLDTKILEKVTALLKEILLG